MNYHSFAEADFARFLLDFLKEKRYPEESIVYEPTLPSEGRRRYRPDFAIVDPERQEHLAIIELKARSDERNRQMAIVQLQAYARAVRDKAVALFGLTPFSVP